MIRLSTHCHRKNFAPKDLRQANLPDRDEVPHLFMPSPVKGDSPSKQSPITPSWTHRNQSSPPPIFKRVSESVKEIQDKSLTSNSPDRSLADVGSPKRRWTQVGGRVTFLSMCTNDISVQDSNRWSSPVASSSRPSQPLEKVDDNSTEPSEDAEPTGDAEELEEDEKKFGDISNVEVPKERIFASPLRSTPTSFATNRAMSPNFTGPPSPLRPTMTGTRYGAALTSNYTGNGGLNGPLSPTRNLNNGRPGSPTKGLSPLSPLATGGGWSPRASPLIGGGTPRCAHCEKPVYFAEQVKAVGKIFHKPCLRCTDCNASLDSNRLAEKDGRVVCRSCYSKVSRRIKFSMPIADSFIIALWSSWEWLCLSRQSRRLDCYTCIVLYERHDQFISAVFICKL